MLAGQTQHFREWKIWWETPKSIFRVPSILPWHQSLYSLWWMVYKKNWNETDPLSKLRTFLTAYFLGVCPMAWAMWKLVFPSHLRTNDFPTSLGGKGHDTGVVCRWLQSVLCGLDPSKHSSQGSCSVDTCCWEAWAWQAEDCNTQILEIMRYTICQCNAFFDILYSHGVFLPESDSAAAKRSAIDMCETWLCFHKALNQDNLLILCS